MNRLVFQLVGLLVLLVQAGSIRAGPDWPGIVESADGVTIAYEVSGEGDPTLVLIHGWSCDARYWRAQVPHLSRNHRVVAIDLAGHGHSGLGREAYSMHAFGQDVNAVLDELQVKQAILIGHSMGGPVSVAAATAEPGRVVGIIGVDTFQMVGQAMSEAEAGSWVEPLRADFPRGARAFVAGMFSDATDSHLRDWVIADMASAPPAVAISAMEHMLADMISGQAREAFADLAVPIVAINADIWPTDIEGNRRLQSDFQAVIIEDTDHFLHMAEPEAFNRVLDSVLADLIRGD